MEVLGHQGIRRAKTHRTTIPAEDGIRAGDLLNRDRSAAAPNVKWVTDFTYVRTWAGFVYVCFIVDCFAQKIVAWHAATTKTTELVMTPLRIAIWQRDRDGHPAARGELICHSDAGSQFTSVHFTEHLALEGIQPSIGSVGDAYDALAESRIGLFKAELFWPHGPWRDRDHLEAGARLGALVQQRANPRIDRRPHTNAGQELHYRYRASLTETG